MTRWPFLICEQTLTAFVENNYPWKTVTGYRVHYKLYKKTYYYKTYSLSQTWYFSDFLKSFIYHVRYILNNRIQNMNYTFYIKNFRLHTNSLRNCFLRIKYMLSSDDALSTIIMKTFFSLDYLAALTTLKITSTPLVNVFLILMKKLNL